MRTLENGRGRVERHRRAVAEVRKRLAGVYRGFVAWGSLYEDAEDEHEKNKERVVALIMDLCNGYIPRSLWLEEGTRKKIEGFIKKSNELCSEFSSDVEKRGYERARADIARRVSKELGSLKKSVEKSLEAELADPSRHRWRLFR